MSQRRSFLDDYEPVEERLRRFWSDHQDGRVQTDIVEHDEKRWVIKASVWREGVALMATGYAEEIVGSSNVNRTSALENCETSAIGRALANAGYSAKGKPRPSREEMNKVAGSGPSETASARKPPEPHGDSTPTSPDVAPSPPPQSGPVEDDSVAAARPSSSGATSSGGGSELGEVPAPSRSTLISAITEATASKRVVQSQVLSAAFRLSEAGDYGYQVSTYRALMDPGSKGAPKELLQVLVEELQIKEAAFT